MNLITSPYLSQPPSLSFSFTHTHTTIRTHLLLFEDTHNSSRGKIVLSVQPETHVYVYTACTTDIPVPSTPSLQIHTSLTIRFPSPLKKYIPSNTAPQQSSRLFKICIKQICKNAQFVVLGGTYVLELILDEQEFARNSSGTQVPRKRGG